jgi:fatty-acyl-CoA synthase
MSSRLAAPTLVDAVRAIADDQERGFVFVQPDGTERLYTFHAIAAQAERRASQLVARGLNKGDRVALVIPDGDEFVFSFLGALFAGGIPVPIYPQVGFKDIQGYHETVAHIAQASGAAMLVTTAASKPFVDPAVARASSTLHRVLTVQDLAQDTENVALPVDVRVDPDDLALLQFTSGSTARPKGVMVTHANLAANAAAFMIDGLHRDERTDKGVSWLPLFHDMGLIGFVVGPLFTHVPCVFLPTASFVRSPRIWLDKIHRHRGTITYAPSFAYALVAKRLKEKDVEDLDLSCLRVAGCGAEPIRARALRDFAARLAPARFDARAFVPSYGMAEATLAITFAPLGDGLRTDEVDSDLLAKGEARRTSGPDRARQEVVACGVSFPGHELAIVDELGRRLGDRCVGQIVTRGPSVTKGYFRDPDLTAQALKPIREADGSGPGTAAWLHTGDLGYLADGRLYICGRSKEIIIIRGRNYYPSDIEWAVGELPAVRRGNAVAFGAQFDGEEKLVVCCEGASSDVTGIQEGVRMCIGARFGLEVHEVAVAPPASLPRTSSGKPQRNKARQMYLNGALPRARSMHGPAEPGEAVEYTEDGNAPIVGPHTT